MPWACPMEIQNLETDPSQAIARCCNAEGLCSLWVPEPGFVAGLLCGLVLLGGVKWIRGLNL